MITKGEKRVIALLMTAVMCMPAAMLPVLPARAETTEEIVQEEGFAEEGITEEGFTEEGTEMTEAPEQLMEEIIQPKDETADAVDGVADENVEESENVLDVTPGSYTTEISESGEQKIYNMQLEQSGLYIFYCDTARSVQLTNGDTVYRGDIYERYIFLDATQPCRIRVDLGGLTGTVSWSLIDLNQSEQITAGAQHTSLQPGETAYYRFIPEEDGRYAFSNAYGYSRKIYDKDGNMTYEKYMELKAGEVYYIAISSYDAGASQEIDWAVEKMQGKEIQAGVLYRMTESDVGTYYIFTPETSNTYKANGMTFYNTDWSNPQYGTAELEVGKTYYLMASYMSNRYWSVESEVTETGEVIVEAGNSYTTKGNQELTYQFTPESSSRYHFWSEKKDGWDMLSFVNGKSYYGFEFRTYLEGGNKTEFQIRPENITTGTIWHIAKIELSPVTIDQEYVTEADEEVEYEFIPAESGDYRISSENLGRCEVYDDTWNRTERYNYIDDSGFGAIVHLEADKTYYISIQPKEREASWRISRIEESGEFRYMEREDGTVEIQGYSGEAAAVKIPDKIDGKNVVSIGKGAFVGNTALETVEVPSTVTELQYGAFDSCSSLKEVAFESGSQLQTIGNMAFSQCAKLNEIHLPDTVQTIGQKAFRTCTSLTDIQLGDKLETIGDYAFYSTGITTVRIPDSVTEVGEHAFEYSDLREVELGTGMDGIPKGMFNSCENITAIEIPENITYIGDSAFSNTGLTEIDLPDSVTSIGNGAFMSCPLNYVKIGNQAAYIGGNAFSNCELTEVILGEQTQILGERSFAGNKELESVTLPNSVTEIQYGAFSGCTNLLDIEIPDSVEAIDGKSFEGTAWYDAQADGIVYAGKVLYNYKGEMPQGTIVDVKEGTKGIAGYAFYWQLGIEGINIPDTVTNIGPSAFAGCENLKEVTIPGSVTKIGEGALGYLDKMSGYKVPDFLIRGLTGSEAERYALENGFRFESTGSVVAPGDVEGDGVVDVADLRMVLRNVCGKAELTETQSTAADVEKDGNVDTNDLRKLLRYICNKIDTLE